MEEDMGETTRRQKEIELADLVFAGMIDESPVDD